MNNILNTLAFSIFSNKGVYALMLGSGLSKTAGIPTGWDIVIDLIKQLAKINGEIDITDYEKWFINKYQEDPNYSVILSKFVSTSTERVNLLRDYFEPTEEERENNLKEPTAAHIAIAELIKKGYIKVVITTNFDRLLEKALDKIGITPQVICHQDDIDGAIPLVHAPITIIKINGDYIDCRFLNTQDELKNYHPKLKEYVLKVINDFGLITCGWSGKWDHGFINILKQSENYRYNSFFTYLYSGESDLKGLAELRKGQTLKINGADHFFKELSEKIEALEEFNNDHPITKDIAIARLKKYISRPEGIISYNDLLESEREKAYPLIFLNNYHILLDKEALTNYFEKQIQALDTLIPLCIISTRWSKQQHEQTLLDIISRFFERPKTKGSYYSNTLQTHYFAGMMILYAIGLSCVKYEKFSLLNKILNLRIPTDTNSIHADLEYLILKHHPQSFEDSTINKFFNDNKYTPFSTLFNQTLKKWFNNITLTEIEYNLIFDVFEYFISLQYHYLNRDSEIFRGWVPGGEFEWKARYYNRNNENPFTNYFDKANELKDEWLPLKYGMFNGDYKVYTKLRTDVDEWLNKRVCYH